MRQIYQRKLYGYCCSCKQVMPLFHPHRPLPIELKNQVAAPLISQAIALNKPPLNGNAHDRHQANAAPATAAQKP